MYDYLISNTEKQEELLRLISDVLGNSRNHYSNKQQITFDCPRCSYEKGVEGDGKGNLEVNYEMGKFNCWACGEHSGTHGDIYRLIKTWGTPEQLKRYRAIGIQFKYNSDSNELRVAKSYDALELPKEYVSLTNVPNVGTVRPFFNYLHERGITQDMINTYQIGCAFSGKYKDRIVIPSYNAAGELNYWVTRTIHEWKKKFKYLNCTVPKQTIIFNEKHINWDKTVFLVEGPFDHIVLPNSIPLLGKQLSDLLFCELYYNAEADIVLILDPEAEKRTVQIYNKLDGGRLMNRIKFVRMPQDSKGRDIDVSKYNELYGQQNLQNYIRNGRIKLVI